MLSQIIFFHGVNVLVIFFLKRPPYILKDNWLTDLSFCFRNAVQKELQESRNLARERQRRLAELNAVSILREIHVTQ